MADITIPAGMSQEEFAKYFASFIMTKNWEAAKKESQRLIRIQERLDAQRYKAISNLPYEQRQEAVNTPVLPAPWLVYKAPFDSLPIPLPEGLVVSREWNVFNGFLISPSQHYLWKSPTMKANQAPQASNSTGLYSMAFNPILGVNLLRGNYSEDCRGLCECLGTTVIHSDGRVRSEELRLLCLFAKDEDTCASLSGRYGIPSIPLANGQLLGTAWKSFIRDQYIEFMRKNPLN